MRVTAAKGENAADRQFGARAGKARVAAVESEGVVAKASVNASGSLVAKRALPGDPAVRRARDIDREDQRSAGSNIREVGHIQLMSSQQTNILHLPYLLAGHLLAVEYCDSRFFSESTRCSSVTEPMRLSNT